MKQEISIKKETMDRVEALVGKLTGTADRWLRVLKKSKVTITIQTEENK